jgi:hypothetical protein
MPPFTYYPPAPPREYNADGTLKTYPLHQPLFDHGFDWEHWNIYPAGVFHTVYIGDFATFSPRHWAWMCAYPTWVGFPLLLFMSIVGMTVLQNAGSIGIRPKRYTEEWVIATKERERVENCNPVTRYLDRRRAERGSHFVIANYLPYHAYFMWMRNSHDWEEKERRERLDAERLEAGIDVDRLSK